MAHPVRVGIGGWQFEPWRETFYPKTLAQKNQLKYASRKLTAIEVNATYYSSFKPDTFARWADEVPEDFVFSLKAHRFSTVRKTREAMKTSIDAFLDQGITRLRQRLGPINWQFPATRAFDRDYFEMFLGLLPKEKDRLPLRHALEVRGAGFDTPAFYELLAKHGATAVYAEDDEFPKLRHAGGDFAVARLMQSKPDNSTGYARSEIDRFAKLFEAWSMSQDVYAFFISGAKERNPAAGMALLNKLGATPSTSAEADELASEKRSQKQPAMSKTSTEPETPGARTAASRKTGSKTAGSKATGFKATGFKTTGFKTTGPEKAGSKTAGSKTAGSKTAKPAAGKRIDAQVGTPKRPAAKKLAAKK